jgi:putative tricarboxylic transport membrane protein
MDVLHNLFYGFSVGLQPSNIFYCFLGVLMGTLVGVLPGIGPVGAISILLPVTFRMDPIGAIIMLAGIYYGSQYGGSTTSILVNIPGEASSIVTCLDGYQMAKQGRAGAALGIAAFGSFIAGTLGVVGLMIFAIPLANFGLKFGGPEYFAAVFLGLTLVSYFSRGSKIKAFIMAAFGIILSCIGLDPIMASPRMTFNMLQLWDGVDLVSIAMGIFGIGEILVNIEETTATEILKTKIKNLFPSLLDWMQSIWSILRGTVIGFFLGILPGGGAVISSFVSYAVEKRLSRTPERFGKGAIEGVAGPESANNAAASGAFIPLFTLGIPTNAIMALLFGALLIHGFRPGPLLLREHPEIFWGVVSSMYLGNAMLLILNLPLIPLWVKVLKIPYRILFPLILLFCLVGAYSLKNDIFPVLVMIIFGIVGYLFRKFDYEGAPLLLAFVLGPLFELNLRQSLLVSKGSFLIFFTRPISAVFMTFGLILIILSVAPILHGWPLRVSNRP